MPQPTIPQQSPFVAPSKPQIPLESPSDRMPDSLSERDLERLADLLEQRMQANIQPIRLDFLDGNGNIYRSQEARPGGTLQIPPVNLQIRRSDGTITGRKEPLGKPITIKFSPQ